MRKRLDAIRESEMMSEEINPFDERFLGGRITRIERGPGSVTFDIILKDYDKFMYFTRVTPYPITKADILVAKRNGEPELIRIEVDLLPFQSPVNLREWYDWNYGVYKDIGRE